MPINKLRPGAFQREAILDAIGYTPANEAEIQGQIEELLSSSNTSTYVFEGTTQNQNETEIFLNGELNNRLLIATNKTIYYSIDATAKTADNSDFVALTIKGVATNKDDVVIDVGSLYEVIIVRTDSRVAVDIEGNNTNKSISVLVTGVENKTFNWKAQATVLEV
jgi:hypothetical protein